MCASTSGSTVAMTSTAILSTCSSSSARNWGFGISLPGPDDPISFQIGAAALVLGRAGRAAGLAAALGRLRWEIACFASPALAAAFAGLQSAAPLWELPIVGSDPPVGPVPLALVGITALCVSVLAGLVGHRAIDRR